MFVEFFQKNSVAAYRAALLLFFVAVLSSPVFVFAQGLPSPISDIKTKIADILNYFVFFLIALAFVVFLWGVYRYITVASLDGKAGAKETIIYGLIGLFVMLAAWGMVNILLDTFEFREAGAGILDQNKIPKVIPQSSPIFPRPSII